MEIQYLKVEKICAICGNQFEGTETTLFGHKVLIGRYCQMCSDKMLEIERQKSETEKQAEISASGDDGGITARSAPATWRRAFQHSKPIAPEMSPRFIGPALIMPISSRWIIA